MNKTCCFTGHRPKSLPFGYDEGAEGCKRLKALLTESIEKQITENGVTHFISGMAMGVDIYAAEAVLELKRKASAHNAGMRHSLRNPGKSLERRLAEQVLRYYLPL